MFQLKEGITSNEYIPACPVFADQEGTKVIFHAYKKTEFGHGLSHCYNRPINIFEAEVLGKGEEIKTKVKMFKTENRTSIFPTVSTCFQYLVFFAGDGITHTYDLDLLVFRKTEASEWQPLHKIQDAAVGLYNVMKAFGHSIDGQQYIFYQTLNRGVQKIMRLHL